MKIKGLAFLWALLALASFVTKQDLLVFCYFSISYFWLTALMSPGISQYVGRKAYRLSFLKMIFSIDQKIQKRTRQKWVRGLAPIFFGTMIAGLFGFPEMALPLGLGAIAPVIVFYMD
jgi:hypothetical protein